MGYGSSAKNYTESLLNRDDYHTLITMDRVSNEYTNYKGPIYGNSTSVDNLRAYLYGKKSEDGKTYYWYCDSYHNNGDSPYQCNMKNHVYYYLAIG